jgi:hypothetical protein
MNRRKLLKLIPLVGALLIGKGASAQLKEKKNLFIAVFKIERGTSTQMPSDLKGALVPAFSAAPDPEKAIKLAASKLTSQGFRIVDVQTKVHQLDPNKWEEYVQNTWPEFKSHFPSQAQVLSGVKEGVVFFGPFAGYEQ